MYHKNIFNSGTLLNFHLILFEEDRNVNAKWKKNSTHTDF